MTKKTNPRRRACLALAVVVDPGRVVVVGEAPLPEPMAAPDPVHHLVDGHALGLRQQREDEDGHDHDPGGEEEEDEGAHGAHHGQERLRDEEGEEHVGADGEREARRARLQRERLRRDEPPERAPGPGEAGHVDADEHDDGHRPRLAGVIVGPHMHQHDRAHGRLRHQHLRARLQQELAAADSVDEDDGHDGRHDVDAARDHGRQQGAVGLEAHGLEQHRRVEHERVDARELLEHLHGDRDHQRRAALGAHQPAVWLLLLAERAGKVARGPDLVELGAHVGGAADLLQRPAAGVGAAALHQARGRLGDGERAEEQHGGGRRRAAQRVAPAERVRARREVVDDAGDEDADGDVELEEDVERATDVRRRDLGQEQRRRLVAEADADAEADAAHDEHGDVGGGRAQRRAGQEEDRRRLHRALAPEPRARARRHEAGHQRRQVQRRREELQPLVVELAVVVLPGAVLARVHRREEELQEVVHGRHPTCRPSDQIISIIPYTEAWRLHIDQIGSGSGSVASSGRDGGRRSTYQRCRRRSRT
jgi:hypothetical protein